MCRSGGRSWLKVHWTIQAFGYDVSAIQSLVDAAGDDISVPIVIPKELLNFTTYQVTLTLRNFLLQESAVAGTFAVSDDVTQPVLNILGPSSVILTSKQALSLQAQGQVSSCVASAVLFYSWNVYKGNVLLPHIVSKSANPAAFKLDPHILEVNTLYTVEAVVTVPSGSNATSSVTVFIIHGLVVAVIKGGASRSAPVDQPLRLDGSRSYDEDSDTAVLAYAWTCSIASSDGYGDDCSSVFGEVATNFSTVVVAADQMEVDTSYAFQLAVSSADGRVSVASTTVSIVAAGSPSIEIVSSSFVKMNINDRVNITSKITASLPTIAYWTIITTAPAVDIAAIALTASNRSFSANDTAGGIKFPLATQPNVFSFGAYYTFRLTCALQSKPSLFTTADVEVVINSPPTSGTLTSSPGYGNALVTLFTFAVSAQELCVAVLTCLL